MSDNPLESLSNYSHFIAGQVLGDRQIYSFLPFEFGTGDFVDMRRKKYYILILEIT
jgi:hypothetical protein